MMGTAAIARKVKLISGLLAKDDKYLLNAKKTLQREFGAIDLESGLLPFTYTRYYNEEMGENIIRQYISFDKLIRPDTIAEIKLKTNSLEKKFSVEDRRMVNIDPGYVDLSKMILATTKDATYRVYIKKGIYCQSTLFYKDKTFQEWPWTYSDYKEKTAIEFFNKVRDAYKPSMVNRP